MPIINAVSDRYPNEIWENHDAFNSEGRWWCAHTKPRQEKAVARDLAVNRVTYYLPQITRQGRTPRGRGHTSQIPLFPGYLFLFGAESSRLIALKTNRLVQLLWVEAQDDLVRDLRQIYVILSSGRSVAPESKYPVGTWVRIVQGPFDGMIGVVSRRGQGERFTAIVQFLGQGASIDLENWQVEAMATPVQCRRTSRSH
jgi:transcriptional antiterminator RfaH